MNHIFLHFILICLFSFIASSSFTFDNNINDILVEKDQLISNNFSMKISNDSLDIKEIKDDAEFEYELSNLNKPIIVDFYSTTCSPCKKLSEILKSKNQILKEKIKILKVNTDMIPLLAIKYNITSTPTVIVFDNNNKLLFKKVGIVDIINFLNLLENLKDKNNNEISQHLKNIK
jgi:thioredoxin 1